MKNKLFTTTIYRKIVVLLNEKITQMFKKIC
jgi:hypothetical protein